MIKSTKQQSDGQIYKATKWWSNIQSNKVMIKSTRQQSHAKIYKATKSC